MTQNNILRIKQVLLKSGLSRTVMYDLIQQGSFPKQIKLAERSCGWLESEINEWINKRASERDAT